MGVSLNPLTTAVVKRLPSLQPGMGSTLLHSHLQTQEPSSTTPERWNTRECYEELHNRPWAEVLEFYSLVAIGKLSFSDLTFHSQWTGTQEEKKSSLSSFSVHSKANSEKLRGGKWLRKTFKIVLSYDGSAFMGWQKQPGLHTVQGLVEKALGRFVDGKRAKALEAQGENVEANVTVAGRTDKGVHAIGQVCSFYTWRQEVDKDEIRAAINAMAPKALKVVNVEEVRREFHPNFSAKQRCYVYLLPLHDNEGEGFPLYGLKGPTDLGFENGEAKKEAFIPDGERRCIDVEAVDGLLRQLEARTLSYTAFARDTQKSRSNGPATECTIYRARAVLAELPEVSNEGRRRRVMCIQLVADRFLRKMVRVLVATAVREAMAGAASDSLFQLLQGTSRRASAPPAPPFGLCLAHVGYEDDDQFQCFLFGPN